MNRPAAPIPSPLSRDLAIASVALAAIALHLILRFAFAAEGAALGFPGPAAPLLAALAVGGVPLVAGLGARLARREFSSRLLAGLSIVAAAVLGEYLAGT